MAFESSDEDVTVEASSSEVEYILRQQSDPMPGKRPTPVYPPNYCELMKLEAQVLAVGVPGNPHEPPGMLAPGEYGPYTVPQTLMRMHAAQAEEYPD
eukprot:9133004-Pyramimonas_sp.AAC.1